LRHLLIALILTFFIPFAAAQDDPTPFEQTVAEAKSQMMADPPLAYEAAQKAGDIADANGNTEGGLTAAWLQGEALIRMNRPGDAVPVLDAALETVETSAPRTKLQADLSKARGDAASAMGNYGDGLSYFQAAHEIYLDVGEQRSQAITLLNIANIYADARNFERALAYYEQAGEAYQEDPNISLARLNNVATAHRELGDYQAAANGLHEALDIANQMDSDMLRVRILSNLAAVQMDQGDFSTAAGTLQQGVDIESEASTGWEQFLYGLQARLALADGNVSRAVNLMDRTFEGIEVASTPAAFTEFHESAYEIYHAAGQDAKALAHLEAFKRLDDNMRDISATANTALLGAQFDFATQELQIERLRTDALEREVALNQARARQRQAIFIGGLALMLIVLVGGTTHYFSMRRSRNEVRDTNVKLNDSNTALEKALQAKSEFLATTSHEIRTPLNAILGMSQLLVAQKSLDEDARERASLVHSSGMTMKAVVDDILDMAKLESGVASVDLADCDLADTLNGVTRTWIDEANGKGVELTGDFAACHVTAVTDERKLRQVMLNLVSNAVKFTENGTIAVKGDLVEAADTSWLTVTIADTGCGIPAEQLDLIFEPFHQVDTSTTRQYAGTGLGLAISRKLVDALGGTITVTSEIEEGATFTLRIPVTEIRQPDEMPAASDDAHTLLCIMANPMQQTMLEAFLSDDETEVKSSESLDMGIMLAAASSPHAIFVSSDVLTGGDAEVLQSLGTLKSMSEASRIIVWKSDDCAISREAILEAGIDDVIDGGFEPMKIKSVITGTSEAGAVASDDEARPAVSIAQ
jgi:signal transduction histidine kinase